jgi:murein DD-endopeptidase MepM/ murein hydrolase activator NlpD
VVEEIIAYPGNDLDPDDPELRPGQELIVPGGWRDLLTWELPVVTRTRPSAGGCGGSYTGPIGSYTFIWPGSIHSVSGNEYLPTIHPGIDIAAWTGMPVYASDTGVVVYSGWNDSGYGNLVIIDHGNGWQTAYAHNSQLNVRCGQTVYQGGVIALAGSTGRSTGAHIHFEMRSDLYGRVNPWLYLPPP